MKLPIVSILSMSLAAVSLGQIPVPLGDLSPGPSAAIVGGEPHSFTPVDAAGQSVLFLARRGREQFSLWECRGDGSSAREVAVLYHSLPREVPLFAGMMRGRALVHQPVAPGVSESWLFDPVTGESQRVPLAAPVLSYVDLSDRTVVIAGPGGEPRVFALDGQLESAVELPFPQFRGATPTFTVVGGQCVTVIERPDGAKELWATDGTIEGTRGIGAYPIGTRLGPAFSIGTRAAFWLRSATVGGIWVTDGTANGTARVLEVASGLVSDQVTGGRAGHRAVFSLNSSGAWSTDGTVEGTFPLTYSDGSVIAGLSSNFELTAPSGERRMVFARTGGLSSTDGTSAGTVRLTSATRSTVNTTEDLGVAVIVETTSSGRTLVRTDGTPAGTSVTTLSGEVLAVLSGRRPLATPLGTLCAASQASAGTGVEIGHAFGQPSSLRVVELVGPVAAGGVVAGITVGDRLVFSASGRLASTGGTPGSTVVIGDVEVRTSRLAGASTEYPFQPFVALASGLAAFGGMNTAGDQGLFVSDGTAANTFRVAGTEGLSSIQFLDSIDGAVYFVAASTRRVFRTDGTGPGTRVVGEFPAYPSPVLAFRPEDARAVGDELFVIGAGRSTGSGNREQLVFRIRANPDRIELVGAGGEFGGASRIAAHTSGWLYLYNQSLIPFADTGYSLEIATGSIRPLEDIVYRGDSRAGGAVLLQGSNMVYEPLGTQLRAVEGLAQTGLRTRIGSKFVVGKTTTGEGVALHAWDAATQRLELLFDPVPGPFDGEIGTLDLVQDSLAVFAAWNPQKGRELYVTDGTAAGTRLLCDTRLGPESGIATGSSFARIGNLLFFGSNDGIRGEEPFVVSLCIADFNSDRQADADDLADFLNCYFAATENSSCPYADTNRDGGVDADDLAEFINAFFVGCE